MAVGRACREKARDDLVVDPAPKGLHAGRELGPVFLDGSVRRPALEPALVDVDVDEALAHAMASVYHTGNREWRLCFTQTAAHCQREPIYTFAARPVLIIAVVMFLIRASVIS